MIPPFLVAKVYVKGSLKNTETGFEFSVKNIIDSTMLTGLGPIDADGKSYGGEAVMLMAGDKVVSAAGISPRNPVTARLGMVLKVSVTGDRLAAGPQRVSVTVVSADIGQIQFSISETVA